MTIQYQGVWTLAQQAQLQSTQQWATDPLYKNTTLLLQADDAANGAQNNTFLDSSNNSFPITRNGNTAQGSYTPFSQVPGRWSVNFNRGRLNATLTGKAPGTGSFTYELFFWAYDREASISSQSALFNSRGGGTGSDGIDVKVEANGSIVVGTAAQILFASALGLAGLNTWYHLAIVRNGSTNCTVYLDGVSVGTFTFSNNCASTDLSIGVFGGASNDWFRGHISNFRYTRAAVYTTNFAVPTASLEVISNTEFLTCRSNRLVDASANAFVVTPAILNGTLPVVHPFSPFTPQFQWTPSVIGGSAYFDNAVDSLTISTAINNQIGALAGKQRTYEFWVNTSGIQALTGFVSGLLGNFTTAAVNGRYAFSLVGTSATSSQTVRFSYTTGTGTSANITTTNGLNQQSWNHIAITIDATTSSSSTIVIYLNGVGQTFTAVNLSTHTTDPSINFVLGDDRTGNQLFWGYVGGVKISSGIQRSSNFTPPTSPFTSDANTILLLNFTNAAIFDGAMKNNIETAGNAQISATVAKYGSGSMYFDGANDYLLIPTNAGTALGAGDFTVEMWVYVLSYPASGAFDSIWGCTTAVNVATGFHYGIDSSGQLFIYQNSAFRISATSSSGVLPRNVWNHVAIVRSAGVVRIYVNGVAAASTWATTQNFSQGGGFIGAAPGGGGEYFEGFLDDLRVTTGVARYTQNFIPPSVALPRQ